MSEIDYQKREAEYDRLGGAMHRIETQAFYAGERAFEAQHEALGKIPPNVYAGCPYQHPGLEYEWQIGWSSAYDAARVTEAQEEESNERSNS